MGGGWGGGGGRGGAVKPCNIDMQETQHLDHLSTALRLLLPTMQELLDAHALDCCHAQRTKFPEDPRCRFTNIQTQLTTPFVVYPDFESILQRVDEALDTTQGVAVGGGDEPISASGPFQEHLCSFAYKLVSSVVPDFSRPLLNVVKARHGKKSEFKSLIFNKIFNKI